MRKQARAGEIGLFAALPSCVLQKVHAVVEFSCLALCQKISQYCVTLLRLLMVWKSIKLKILFLQIRISSSVINLKMFFWIKLHIGVV